VPEKGVPKLLRLAVILVPAVIFFGFYLKSALHRPETSAPVRPPALTVNAGDTVTLGDDSFRADPPFFTRTIREPDNTIMADPNQTFLIVPVVILRDNRPSRPAGLTWQMVDDNGAPHPLISPRSLQVPPRVKLPSRLDPRYLVFSLPDDSRKPFLLLSSPWGRAAWYCPRKT